MLDRRKPFMIELAPQFVQTFRIIDRIKPSLALTIAPQPGGLLAPPIDPTE
jgi:hypothetical protein